MFCHALNAVIYREGGSSCAAARHEGTLGVEATSTQQTCRKVCKIRNNNDRSLLIYLPGIDSSCRDFKDRLQLHLGWDAGWVWKSHNLRWIRPEPGSHVPEEYPKGHGCHFDNVCKSQTPIKCFGMLLSDS
jgi:hypothetical protein